MIRRYCDLCNKELSMVDNRDHKTQWYEIKDGLHGTKTDVCNECLTKILAKVDV